MTVTAERPTAPVTSLVLPSVNVTAVLIDLARAQGPTCYWEPTQFVVFALPNPTPQLAKDWAGFVEALHIADTHDEIPCDDGQCDHALLAGEDAISRLWTLMHGTQMCGRCAYRAWSAESFAGLDCTSVGCGTRAVA